MYILLFYKIVKHAEDHLLLATKARSYLKGQVAKAKEDLKAHFVDRGLGIPHSKN
jgi:hypothetical protein